jgi:hypothetical protein
VLSSRLSFGLAPALALVAAVGILMVAFGNNAAREGSSAGAQALFWIGLMTIYAPIAFRLLSSSASRAERIALVLTVGMSLFVVKVLYSPTGPTPYDEMGTWRQIYDLLHSGHLFSFNPLVEGYAGFPGLETVSAAVTQLADVSIFHAGLIVIGLARAASMLALFLVLERVTHSARAAGIGVALYVSNPSFLYFDAEIGHESLALLLAAALLLVALRWCEDERLERRTSLDLGLALAMAILAAALAITHHMTSYAMTAFFVVWTLFTAWAARERRRRPTVDARTALASRGKTLLQGPGLPALLTLGAAGAWFIFVAGGYTVNELGGVLTGSIEALINALFGESETKVLFQGSGQTNPAAARAIAIASIVPLLALIPFGLRRVWRGANSTPLWRALAVAGTLYPLTLGLRLTLAGSETSQRASEFVFVGLAFFAAVLIGGLRWPTHPGRRFLKTAALTIVATGVFLGGVIVSTLPANRQPGPFLVSAEARSITPQGLAVAEFASSNLPPESRVLVDRPNATLLASYGHLNPVFGQVDGIPVARVLFSQSFDRRDRRVIEDDAIDYIVVDLRQSGALPVVGYYVESFEPGAFTRKKPVSRRALRKFNSVPGLSRIYTNGSIVVYDSTGLQSR